MHLDTPHVIDVIASGIHDVKNSMFDALARVHDVFNFEQQLAPQRPAWMREGKVFGSEAARF